MYKVIIVEDEPLIRQGLIYTFDWESHNCIIVGEAANGIEGIELIKTINPDIVITDVGMPIKDGLEMLQDTQEYAYRSIILSVFDEFNYAKKAINLEVVDYLLKPLDPKQLSESLKKIIKKKKSKSKKIPIPTIDLQPLSSSKANSHMKKILEYIRENYRHKITLQDLKNLTGMGSTFIAKQFKSYTGHTFVDYLNRVRVKNATKLMLTTDIKIYSIAKTVGFYDYKHFIRVFKKYLGYSPSEFINIFGSHTNSTKTHSDQ